MILSLKTVSFEAHNATTGKFEASVTFTGVRRVDAFEDALMLTMYNGVREMFGWVRNLKVS